MSNQIYLDIDVVTAAKERLSRLVKSFDNLVVAFSGGKDSLCVLLLLKEVYRELGLDKRVKAFFYDEEFVDSQIIDFVLYVKSFDWIDLEILTLQMDSEIALPNRVESIIQWGEDRKDNWFRNKPECSLSDVGTVYDIYTMETFSTKYFPNGSIAQILGIRAQESMSRLSKIIKNHKKGFNCFINNSKKTSRVKLCSPIYDWHINDVFKYLYDNNIINEIYNRQLFAGRPLRVDTPLHSKNKKMHKYLKVISPEFFEKLVNHFEELHTLEKYSDELQLSYDNIFDKYGRTWNGLKQYVLENITDEWQRKQALKRIQDCWKRRFMSRKPRGGFNGYPLRYVYREILNGNFEKGIMPKAKSNLCRADYEFEGMPYREA